MHLGQQPVERQEWKGYDAEQQCHVHASRCDTGIERIPVHDDDVAESGLADLQFHFLEEPGGCVQCDHAPRLTNHACCRNCEETGATAYFENRLSGLETSETECFARIHQPPAKPTSHQEPGRLEEQVQ
jgi:hypothetical protein